MKKLLLFVLLITSVCSCQKAQQAEKESIIDNIIMGCKIGKATKQDVVNAIKNNGYTPMFIEDRGIITTKESSIELSVDGETFNYAYFGFDEGILYYALISNNTYGYDDDSIKIHLFNKYKDYSQDISDKENKSDNIVNIYDDNVTKLIVHFNELRPYNEEDIKKYEIKDEDMYIFYDDEGNKICAPEPAGYTLEYIDANFYIKNGKIW